MASGKNLDGSAQSQNRDPLYEQIIRRLKSNRIMVLLLLVFALVVGLSQFLGGLAAIRAYLSPGRTTLQIDAYVQPYDLMTEETETRKPLKPINGGIHDIESIAERLAGEIADAIQPERLLEANLQISGNYLQTSDRLYAYVLNSGNPVQQEAPLQKDLDRAHRLDLLSLYRDPLFFGPQCKCIEIFLNDRGGHFAREYLKIYRNGTEFSFEAQGEVNTKTVRFKPKKSKIILQSFEGAGTSPGDISRTELSLQAALQNKLGKYDFLAISPLTRADLQRKRDEIKSLQPGPGKGELIEQYNVDFIVSGTVQAK